MAPITYGRRAAKRTRSSDERPAKRTKILVEVSPVSTDIEDAEDHQHTRTQRNNHINRNPAKSASYKAVRQDSDTFPREPKNELHSTRPSTPPADANAFRHSINPLITYLARTPTKSQHDSARVINSESPSESSSKKLVKDLSGLFDFASASKPKSTATQTVGLAKRMLSRSRTMSSIDNSKEMGSLESIQDGPGYQAATNADITRGIQMSPSSKSPKPIKLSKSLSFNNTPSPPIRAQNSTLRTYAGTSRSFLVSLPASHLTSDSQNLNNADTLLESQEDLQMHETYSDLRARWGVDNSEDDPRPFPIDSGSQNRKRKGKAHEFPPPLLSVSNNTPIEVKSITELRNKGESRRFQDEVGYLFEGLDPGSNISIRRVSALELITKFSDQEFARKAKVADFTVQAWEVLREAGAGNGDKVLDLALVVFMAFVAQDVRDLVDLANRSDCADVLFKVLKSLRGSNDTLGLVNSSMSDAELKKAGIARAEKSILLSFSKLVQKRLSTISEGIVVSTRSLVAQVLALIPPGFHRSNRMPDLVECILSEISLIPSRVAGYASGLSLLPLPSPTYHLDAPSFVHIESCLRLLEAYLLGRWDTSDSDNHASSSLLIDRRDDFAKGLVACCIATDVLMRDSKSEDMSILARRCLDSALRVLINLSHDSVAWCRTLLQDEYTLAIITRLIMTAHRQRYGASKVVKPDLDPGHPSSSEERNLHAFDRLCLALGLLTNLVQIDELAKDLSRETMLDLSCPNKRSCVRACSCPQRISALKCLVHIYVQHRKGSSEDEVDPVIGGYIAILFGLLLRDNILNQNMVLAALPGSTNRVKLLPLVDIAQEFVDIYGKVMTRLASVDVKKSDEGDDDTTEFAPGGKEQNIVHGVVAFLEVLSESPDS